MVLCERNNLSNSILKLSSSSSEGGKGRVVACSALGPRSSATLFLLIHWSSQLSKHSPIPDSNCSVVRSPCPNFWMNTGCRDESERESSPTSQPRGASLGVSIGTLRDLLAGERWEMLGTGWRQSTVFAVTGKGVGWPLTGKNRCQPYSAVQP